MNRKGDTGITINPWPILLDHYIPHYEGLRRLDITLESFANMEFTPKSYAQLIARMELINQPGTEFHYSSFNYILLGTILEQVTGKSYAQLLQEHILTPLGLENTGFGPCCRPIP